jgi:zinc transport system substrate-binding protein
MEEMNHIRSWIIVLLIALLGLSGCGQPAPVSTEGKLVIYTSFYTMYDFTRKLAGDHAVVVNLTPAGMEPHDWEPSVADIRGLEQADMLVYNGLGMEHWVSQVVTVLPPDKLTLVEASTGISGLAYDGDSDPHVWLNPRYAKQELETIKNALVRLDPAHGEDYEANFARCAVACDELDQAFTTGLMRLSRQDIVVAHQAFSYLCAAYGLNQIAIEGVNADSEPSPGKMAEIIGLAKAQGVKVVFYEELGSAKVAQTVADAVGAEIKVLNPIEGLTAEQEAAGEDYFSLMTGNLAVLLTALR